MLVHLALGLVDEQRCAVQDVYDDVCLRASEITVSVDDVDDRLIVEPQTMLVCGAVVRHLGGHVFDLVKLMCVAMEVDVEQGGVGHGGFGLRRRGQEHDQGEEV